MALFDSWSDVGLGVAAGSSISAINSALGVGNSFLSDWFGDNNREESAAQELWNYGKKSFMDWDMYSQNYAPLNQQLQKELFDYTSAGNLANSKEYYDYTLGKNYEANINYIGDSLAARKQALIDNGYNPILAINGGSSVSSVGGSTVGTSGQLGATGSPHSASSSSGGYNSVHSALGNLSLSELVGLASSASNISKIDAETAQIKARTSAIRKMSEVDEAKAALELESLYKETFPGADVTPLDDKGAQDFVRALRNKYQRDAYMNSVERQAILDSLGAGTDVINSAVGVKKAFAKPSAKLLSTTKKGNTITYEYGEP